MKKATMVVLIALAAIMASATAMASVVFQDDFATDPFGSTARWTTTATTWGTVAGYGYDSTNQLVQFWASGMGESKMKSVSTDPVVGGSYAISLDFQYLAGIGGSYIAVWADRQLDDTHYFVQAYIGGSGAADWYWGGGTLPGGNLGNYQGQLAVGTWYTFKLNVDNTAISTTLTAEITDKTTGMVAVPAVTVTDSNAGHFTNASGFGFECGVSDASYQNFVAFDNFTVTKPSYTVSGTVVPSDYSGDLSKIAVNIDFLQNDSVVKNAVVVLDSAGNFSVPDVDPAVYDVRVKAYASLSGLVTGVDVSAPTNIGTVTLPNGDLDGDNEVTSTDLSILGLNLGMTGN